MSGGAGSDDHMTTTDHFMDFLGDQLADVQAGWSVGTFGAIAEFTRDPGEPAELRRTGDAISIVRLGDNRMSTKPTIIPR